MGGDVPSILRGLLLVRGICLRGCRVTIETRGRPGEGGVGESPV